MTSAHARPHPRESLDRCSVRAELRGDHQLGTAFPAARVLLVEQPGPWGRDGLASSHFDPTVAAELLRRANRESIRVLAVREPGRSEPDQPRRWGLVDSRPGHESLRWGRFTADAELLDLPLDGSTGTPDEEPLFLVCAHGKHDACCALRGRPVAAALAAARPRRVLECSHLGGDRFAANVLVLPSGLLYGQVLALAAEEFVAAADADQVIPALLRGQIGLPSTAQAALAFGYEHLALHRRADLRVERTTPIVEGHAVVRLRSPHGLLEVTVSVEKVAAEGLTCANPRPNQYLRYRPVTIAAFES